MLTSYFAFTQVIRKSDNKVYALKRVKINKMGKKEIADALNEIRFLAGIRHKNIVGFLEAFLGYSYKSKTSFNFEPIKTDNSTNHSIQKITNLNFALSWSFVVAATSRRK